MSPSTESTQFSPYYMLFGKEMPLPIDTALIPEEIFLVLLSNMLLKIELKLNLVFHMQHYSGDDMSWYGVL
jgi:hypothetical protein